MLQSEKADENAGWYFDQCRGSLQEQEKVDRAAGVRWPIWAYRFLSRCHEPTLVEATEHSVLRTIERAHALHSERPPFVLLSEISELLKARLLFAEERTATRYQPMSGWTNHTASGWQRGLLGLQGKDAWLLRVGSRRETFTREQVAHEFGHALFYWDENRVDLHAWRMSPWSRLEESFANFAGRTILIPTGLMSERLKFASNLAEHLVTQIASPFRVPHRVAALRWLDVADHRNPQVQAVVEWRQYHPFHKQYVHACLRRFPALIEPFREFARALDRAVPNASFREARYVWSEAIKSGSLQPDPLLVLQLPPPALPVVNRIREFVGSVRGEAAFQAIEQLTRANAHTNFRPEWVIWRRLPSNAYIPLWRGSAKPQSLAAVLAAQGSSIARASVEAVSIGSLAGEFSVHAFAHGNADEGSRYVLEVFQALSVSS